MESQLFEVFREPGRSDFAEGDLRVELKRQLIQYIWFAVWCGHIRGDLLERLGTAIFARHSAQRPAATRSLLDLKTLRGWVWLPGSKCSEWDEKGCRRIWYVF